MKSAIIIFGGMFLSGLIGEAVGVGAEMAMIGFLAYMLVEIMDKEADLFGDFIVIGGYKLKYANGRFQCLETPTEQHKPWKPNIVKCKTDSLNYR